MFMACRVSTLSTFCRQALLHSLRRYNLRHKEGDDEETAPFENGNDILKKYKSMFALHTHTFGMLGWTPGDLPPVGRQAIYPPSGVGGWAI